jgi:hypothetical protein
MNSSSESGKPWTLGDIRQMNLQLEAYCQTPGCGWFATFDLDKLIDECGPDYVLPDDGPGMPCQKCGGEHLKFKLAYPHPEADS